MNLFNFQFQDKDDKKGKFLHNHKLCVLIIFHGYIHVYMYYFLDDISELCFQALSWISEILLSIEAIHPITGESIPIVVSPDIQNIPYTPDNEHLGMEREREREKINLLEK